MDERCPRKLQDFPESFCPLAVLRLKAIRNIGKELTEEEERALPGCDYFISSQSACYCFFKYIEKYANSSISDVEIAALNAISVETVKKVEKKGLAKLRENTEFQQLRECGIDEDDREFVVHL